MAKPEAGASSGPPTPAVTDDGLKAKMQLVIVILQIMGVIGVGGYCIFAAVVDPVSVGFFCNDDSIRFPLLPQTVPAYEASMIVILIPTVVIIFVDTACWILYGDRFGRYVNLVYCRPSGIVAVYYQSLGGLTFAMLSCYAITFTAKICVGRLRPHFLNVCQPDWKKITCSDANGFLYVEDFVCLGTDKAAIKEARVSFPSSHSSSSMCAMLYVVLYLQSRLVWLSKSGLKQSPIASKCTQGLWGILKLLCPFIQLVAFGGAIFIGLSRIRDKFHHPSDVVTGFAIGAATALFTFFYIAGLDSYPKGSAKERQEEEIEEGV